MNNFFNPFDNFENEKKNIQKKEKTKPTYYSQNKINNLKPYNNSVAHKYLCNTNSNLIITYTNLFIRHLYSTYNYKMFNIFLRLKAT